MAGEGLPIETNWGGILAGGLAKAAGLKAAGGGALADLSDKVSQSFTDSLNGVGANANWAVNFGGKQDLTQSTASTSASGKNEIGKYLMIGGAVLLGVVVLKKALK